MTNVETPLNVSGFYVTGGTLTGNAPSYVTRQADTELMRNLLAGEFCYVLNSRQMGKSSLMVRTSQQLQEQGIGSVVLDLTAFGQNLTLSQWYLGLLSRLGQQLDLDEDLEAFWEAHERMSPLQVWQQALHQVLVPHLSRNQPLHRVHGASAPSLVIFVDEIDVVRSLPFSADEFFAAVRQCYTGRATEQELCCLSFCLLGVAAPADLISNPRTSPFSIGKRVEVRDFTPQEASPLAAGLGGQGPTLLNRVLHWTGGHPYLTQQLCRAASEANAESCDDIDALCNTLFLRSEARQSDDNLAFVQNSLIKSDVDLTGLLDLYQRIRASQGVHYDETDPRCSVLRLSGIATLKDGALALRNRIYTSVFNEDWIAQYRPRRDSRSSPFLSERQATTDAEERPPTPLNNLPAQMTSFIGRARETVEVKALLKKHRLVTLTGAGGTGKTRLSLRAAGEILGDFPDGAWWIELAPLTDPGLVAQEVAHVLNVRAEPGTPLLQSLTAALKTDRMLLVLDNCEHLLTACAYLSHILLHACPGMRILASSREAMRVPGESLYRIPPMSLPASEQDLTSERMNQYEATRLFIERAQSYDPGFMVTDQNAAALVSVCRRLDGLPLAIELAAARARSLSVEEINARLDNRFRLLTGGSRTTLPRQQTLRALIDWSYDLLNEQERRMLARLSVFAGGWDLEAAEAICAGEGIEEYEVLDLLTSLVDKSLLLAEQQNERTRYRMLETVREYARDRRREIRERTVPLKHARHFLRITEQRLVRIRTRTEAAAIRDLEIDADNLRAAMDAAHDEGEIELFARLGLMRGRALWRRGLSYDAVQPVQSALDALQSSEGEKQALLAELLWERAGLCLDQKDLDRAEPLAREALSLFSLSGDRVGQARTENILGQIAHERREYQEARCCYERALEHLRSPQDDTEIANIFNTFGLMKLNEPAGSLEEAARHLQEALRLRRKQGDLRGLAETLNNLGIVAFKQADWKQTWKYYAEALKHEQTLDNTVGIARVLFNLAEVAFERSEMTRTLRLAAAAERLLETVKSPVLTQVSDFLARAGFSESQIEQARRTAGSKSPDALVSWAMNG